MSYDKAVFGGRPVEDPYPGRRQVQDLTAADLREHAAWWFPPEDGHMTGPDICTVMPIDAASADATGACEFPDGRFLLHAVFTLADGSTLDGHVSFSPGDPADVEPQEPTLCCDGGQVPLWHGMIVPDAAFVARMMALLSRPREAVFPVRWRATLHPTSHEIAGEAPGFLVWRGRLDSITP